MTGRPFQDHRQAALALLLHCPETLTRKSAGFLGHCCIATELTPAQRDWLAKLLERGGMPLLAEGAGNG